MIVYNNYAGEIEANVPGMSVPTMKLSLEDGETLVKNIQKGDTKATFELTVSKALGEQVADFSSRGPVMDTWMIKPDISAPGVNIVSTIPTHDSDNPYGYGSKQGTSMASPHIAGAVAVIKQAKPKWSVEQIKSAIMNTAVTLKDGDGKVYPHNTQGAGSARIINTLKADSIVSPGSYSYGTFLKEKGKETKKKPLQLKTNPPSESRTSLSIHLTVTALQRQEQAVLSFLPAKPEKPLPK